jgi:hypothetical protein
MTIIRMILNAEEGREGRVAMIYTLKALITGSMNYKILQLRHFLFHTRIF